MIKPITVATISTTNFGAALKERKKSSYATSEKIRECRRRGLLLVAQVLTKAQNGASDLELCANGLFQDARCEVIDYRIANRGVNSDEVRFADWAEEWLKAARTSA